MIETIESQNQRMIKNIAEIIIHSISNHDDDVIDKGLESLKDIAINFLEKRNEHAKKYKIVERNALINTNPANQYITYVLDELNRIFTIAAEKADNNTTRKTIATYKKILRVALQQPDNTIVLRKFFDHKDYRGSLYVSWLEYCIDKKLYREKASLLNMLIVIPTSFLNENFRIEYVENFITYNTFRVFKHVIDKRDYDTFVNILDIFAGAHISTDHAKYEVNNSLTGISDLFGECDDKHKTSLENIHNVIEYDLVKDYLTQDGAGKSITNELDVLRNISTQCDNPKRFKVQANDLTQNLDCLHVCLLVDSVFFAVGAYLLYKGKEFSSYMKKLWYHVDSNFTNKLPSIDEPLWQYCFVKYEGKNSPTSDQFEFGSYSDYKSYFMAYHMLLSLTKSSYIRLPDADEIHTWSKKSTKPLMFWYDILNSINPNVLLSSLNNLDDDFISAVLSDKMVPELSAKTKDKHVTLEKLEAEIEKLKEDKHLLIQEIEIGLPVSQTLLHEHKQRMKKFHTDRSIAKLATVRQATNSDLKFQRLYASDILPRKLFIAQDLLRYVRIGLVNFPLTNKIRYSMYEFLLREIKPQKNSMNYTDLSNIVKNLVESGYRPSSIFIPSYVYEKIIENRKPRPSSIKINDLELQCILLRDDSDFKDIIIYDKKYLEVIYKDDVSITHSDLDKLKIEFIITADVGINILQHDAFVHLTP